VGVAQRDLTVVGYPVQATGYYGPVTAAAVERFKHNHKLTRNPGIGRPMWRALVAQVNHEQSIHFRPAHLNSHGLAVAPANAPAVVKRAIAAANHIAFTPYCYGGGHASWDSPCYDCSGSTSYALHGGGLLWAPMAYMGGYGEPGDGKWMTIFANHTHVYMRLDGLWFDTVAQQYGSRPGDRWSTKRVDPASGYLARHPFRF
jgi:peptidoglycan hydrolase-like protein with peptidoglycan-binding domain